MLVVQSFHPGDIDQALRFSQWTEELGGAKGHELLLIPDTTCRPDLVQQIQESFTRSFDNVEILPFVDHFKRWPSAPNAIFGIAARHIMRTRPQPWLFCEPDCVPWRLGWLDDLWAEYQVALAADKFFLADFVSVHTPELDVEDHASGNAIYPADMFTHAGSALVAGAGGAAWDMVSKDQILPLLHTSELILHSWRHSSFENWEQVEREILAFKPKVALFHSDKSGSLYQLLREKRNPTLAAAPVPAQTSRGDDKASEGTVTTASVPADSLGGSQSITCDILIKSYPQDYPLLKYCLQSIARFAHGFQNVVLVVPEGEWPAFVNKTKDMPENLKVNKVVEEGRGYLFQQVVKAKAQNYTVSDYVLHLDSDTILTTDITPEMFMREGKPIWFITPYSETCPDIPWRGCTQDFIKHPVEHEYMRRLPMFVPRKVHEAAAQFCITDQGVTIDKWIMDSQHFSEFNALGAVAWDKFHDEIYWFNTAEHPENEWPPLVALQTWSHAPFDETKKTFESILGTEWKRQERLWPQDELSGAEMERPLEPEPLIISNGAGEPPAGVDDFPNIEHPRQNLVVPWANQLESELEIKRLVGELKKFQTSPAYVNRVRMELKLARVIPGHKAIKRMKVRRRRLGGIDQR